MMPSSESVSPPEKIPDGQTTTIFDEGGRFLGHEPAENLLKWHEHRSVGPHRAWCFNCREWCYPDDGCIRCKHPEDC